MVKKYNPKNIGNKRTFKAPGTKHGNFVTKKIHLTATCTKCSAKNAGDAIVRGFPGEVVADSKCGQCGYKIELSGNF